MEIVLNSLLPKSARILGSALLAFAALCGFVSSKASDETPPSATSDQIQAGLSVYTTRCQRCHSEKLAGGAGPALRGNDFEAQWAGKPLRALYGRILMTMPYDDPGSLTPEQVLSLVSYIAKENDFAQWTAPFSTPNELTKITIGRAR